MNRTNQGWLIFSDKMANMCKVASNKWWYWKKQWNVFHCCASNLNYKSFIWATDMIQLLPSPRTTVNNNWWILKLRSFPLSAKKKVGKNPELLNKSAVLTQNNRKTPFLKSRTDVRNSGVVVFYGDFYQPIRLPSWTILQESKCLWRTMCLISSRTDWSQWTGELKKSKCINAPFLKREGKSAVASCRFNMYNQTLQAEENWAHISCSDCQYSHIDTL